MLLDPEERAGEVIAEDVSLGRRGEQRQRGQVAKFEHHDPGEGGDDWVANEVAGDGSGTIERRPRWPQDDERDHGGDRKCANGKEEPDARVRPEQGKRVRDGDDLCEDENGDRQHKAHDAPQAQQRRAAGGGNAQQTEAEQEDSRAQRDVQASPSARRRGYDRPVRELEIDGRRIADDTPCFVIAEIGHNHQGSVEKAQELFVLAKQAGVDAVKLQKRDNRRLFTRALYDSAYDNENSFGPTYGAHREALELDRGAYVELQACARELGLVFFATAFDEASADLLSELDVPAYKIASGDLRNTPLLRHVAAIGKPLIVSTGGATIEDVDRAVDDRDGDQPAALPAAVHRVLPGRRRGARARRDRDVPRALPGARDRPLRPPGRHRDGAGRVHARRARDREALHREPHRRRAPTTRSRCMPEGMRKLVRDLHRVPARDRRRRQAAAPERGGAAREDGEAARRRAAASGRTHPRRPATWSRSRRPTEACRHTRWTICSDARSCVRSSSRSRFSPPTSLRRHLRPQPGRATARRLALRTASRPIRRRPAPCGGGGASRSRRPRRPSTTRPCSPMWRALPWSRAMSHRAAPGLPCRTRRSVRESRGPARGARNVSIGAATASTASPGTSASTARRADGVPS